MTKAYLKNTIVQPVLDVSSRKMAVICKINQILDIIQNTALSLEKGKKDHLFTNGEIMSASQNLMDMAKSLVMASNELERLDKDDIDPIIEKIQSVVDKLSQLISNYGTEHISDLLFITFGSEFAGNIGCITPVMAAKIELIKRHIKPIGYKMISWKKAKNTKSMPSNKSPELCVDKITTDTTIPPEMHNHIECLNIDISTTHQFSLKVHGIRVIIHNYPINKTIIIRGMCDNIPVDMLNNAYLNERRKRVRQLIDNSTSYDPQTAHNMTETLMLKDWLIWGNNDIYKKNAGVNSDIHFVTTGDIETILKKFLDMTLYMQRSIFTNIFASSDETVRYIAYILYDAITVSNLDGLDAHNQNIIYDSLPWKIKTILKDATKNSVRYTQDIVKKYDVNQVTIEQKIYLLQLPETVKEKAFARLKEMKGRPDESSSKARQYLEGLLKIPFNTYRSEPILNRVTEINALFSKMRQEVSTANQLFNGIDLDIISEKPKYTNMEILKYINDYEKNAVQHLVEYVDKNKDRFTLKSSISAYDHISNTMMCFPKYNKKTKSARIQHIAEFLKRDGYDMASKIAVFDQLAGDTTIANIHRDQVDIRRMIRGVDQEMSTIVNVLDKSIYGHGAAKNQILKIISQWMNGKSTGYCFGFEGSPGIGKTSLAKMGISKCLIDQDGKPRPFAFIALGGSCNGSTLEGHNYTYVNALWGRIVDILMETKCMNPIIYIDELDKVSNTESGKEIIGILMHLIDSTQNDVFQDKYFSGINIDLSKVLFIFSYNDPSKIDSVLLDRIHRIKFDNLSNADKLVVLRRHVIPEICERMGMTEDCIYLDDATLEYIIHHYTMEPGIRKLKEILFDIYGEINIHMLKYTVADKLWETFPIQITIDLLETVYLKNYTKITEKRIHTKSDVGHINGLWANVLGKGGVIPIETSLCPSSAFLELNLTGLQGDVMKESMNVAKNVAWSHTPDDVKSRLLAVYEKTHHGGIHIHCPEGGVSKDGPSAGAAVTCALYSLFNTKKIRHNVAMTGEIDLRGNITEIGGLEAKLLGGIRAGATRFLFPESNAADFVKFSKKYGSSIDLSAIEFIQVGHIEHVFEHVFVPVNN